MEGGPKSVDIIMHEDTQICKDHEINRVGERRMPCPKRKINREKLLSEPCKPGF